MSYALLSPYTTSMWIYAIYDSDVLILTRRNLHIVHHDSVIIPTWISAFQGYEIFKFQLFTYYDKWDARYSLDFLFKFFISQMVSNWTVYY